MKLAILPGIGFHNKEPEKFISFLRAGLGENWQVKWLDWKHGYVAPELPYKQDIITRGVRTLLEEVIFDFEYAVLHCEDFDMPIADVYIGHSAGSILALGSGTGNIITMGCPASLIESLGGQQMRRVLTEAKVPVFNIVNEKDIVSFPITNHNAENWYYKDSGPWYQPIIGAHFSYWNNPVVMDTILDKINDWFPL